MGLISEQKAMKKTSDLESSRNLLLYAVTLEFEMLGNWLVIMRFLWQYAS